jgi:hypothetical protein
MTQANRVCITPADPIYAAIAEHQASIQNADRENERLEAAGPDGDWRPTHAALVAIGAAARVLMDTAPTTYAGLRALEDYLNDDRNRSLIGRIERTITTDDGFTYRMGGGSGAVDWFIAKRAAEIDGVAGATAG